MSEFIVDLSNYRDSRGARVSPGEYLVLVEDAEMTKASSGNPMVNLWLRIIGTEFDGLTITDRLVLTEKSMFRLVGFMQAIGLPTPRKKFKLSTSKFVNKRLVVTVEDGDPYRGSIKSEVRDYMRVPKDSSIDGGTDEDADEEALMDTLGDSTEEDAADTPQQKAKALADRVASADSDEAEDEAESESDDLDDLDLDDIDI